MHSSRIRTARSLTVFRSSLPFGGGVYLPGGQSAMGRPPATSLPRQTPLHTSLPRQTPPPPIVEQTDACEN